MFESITYLQEVKIGDNVTTLYNGMFSKCKRLTKVTLGTVLKSIGNNVFKDCTKLATVTCLSETPPSCQTGVFANAPLSTCTLEVPKGTIEAYRATSPWSGFGNIVEQGSDIVEGVSTEDPIRVTSSGNVLSIQNEDEAVQATIFTTDGKQVKAIEAKRGTTQVRLAEGQVYLVKIGGRTFKVAM